MTLVVLISFDIYIYTYSKLLTCIVCLRSSFTGVKRLLWFIWRIIYLLLKFTVVPNSLIMSQTFRGALKQYKSNLTPNESCVKPPSTNSCYWLTKIQRNIRKVWSYDSINLSVTLKTNSKMFAAKCFIKHQMVYVMKLLKLSRKKFKVLKQNVTTIVITSKIKLSEKITNLLRK